MGCKQQFYSHARIENRLLQSREEAEDVTQGVLVKLWQHVNEVDPGRLNAWVMKVARNAVIDAARRRQTRSAAKVSMINLSNGAFSAGRRIIGTIIARDLTGISVPVAGRVSC